jgi:hypothetical protein
MLLQQSKGFYTTSADMDDEDDGDDFDQYEEDYEEDEEDDEHYRYPPAPAR